MAGSSVDINRSAFIVTAPRETRTAGAAAMAGLHITIEPERIVTPTLVSRSWSAEDAQGAFEIYGDPRTAEVGHALAHRGLDYAYDPDGLEDW